jgi:hypothetical protein
MTNAAKLKTTCTLQLVKKEPKTSKDKFETVIIEAVDQSFSSLKNIDKQDVYSYFENAFKINKEEIPSKIEDFMDAIEQMFGIGAKLIEIRILEEIHKKIQDFMFFPNKGDVVFKEYIASLRAFLLQTS